MTGSHPVGKGVSSLMLIVSNQPISSPVLIGREREQAHLHALIDQVGQGHGQAILLSGGAGVGKSRLANEGRRRPSEQGFLVPPGPCFPPDPTFPYAPRPVRPSAWRTAS